MYKRGQETVLSLGQRVTGVAVAIAVFSPSQAAAESTGCAPSERAFFSCSTGSKKVVVCGSKELSANSGSLQYRFGRQAAVELSYPPEGVDWRKTARGGTLTLSGGGGAFLAFTNAPYRYIVYSASGRGWGSKAGVVVEKGGKQIASLLCKGRVKSELGQNLFSMAGIEVADDSFDLP